MLVRDPHKVDHRLTNVVVPHLAEDFSFIVKCETHLGVTFGYEKLDHGRVFPVWRLVAFHVSIGAFDLMPDCKLDKRAHFIHECNVPGE